MKAQSSATPFSNPSIAPSALTWQQWSYIKLDKFRSFFPEFSQTEHTAINQILTGFYRTAGHNMAAFENLKIEVQNLKKDAIKSKTPYFYAQQKKFNQMTQQIEIFKKINSSAELKDRADQYLATGNVGEQSSCTPEDQGIKVQVFSPNFKARKKTKA